jgi:hypothetical protein
VRVLLHNTQHNNGFYYTIHSIIMGFICVICVICVICIIRDIVLKTFLEGIVGLIG